jgi:hypothetical protein
MVHIHGLQVETQNEYYSSDTGGLMAKDWPVWEFGVREKWKCASMETLEVPKLEAMK